MSTGNCLPSGSAVHELLASMYPVTSDYIVVVKWLGFRIDDDFIEGLKLKGKETEILEEAKRLEAESKSK